MHKPIIYRNSRGKSLEFGSRELFINDTDIFDYSWNYDTGFGRISNFRRGEVEKKLIISIYGATDAEATERRNRVFEVCEQDVLTGNAGRLWVGDYYLNCYITEGKVKAYNKQGRYLQQEIKIITDTPVWIKETKYNFYVDYISGNSFYPHGYPYDYANSLRINSIFNSHFTDSNFELTIYGAVTNPTVYINGSPYTVNTELLTGERLTINSIEKTIIKTEANGTKANEFNKRDKVNSVFKLIETGSNLVSWNKTFSFDLTLFSERSAPEWT